MDRRHDRVRARRTRSHGSPHCPRPAACWSKRRAGAWIIREDGSKRHLGDYDRATWSPNGRFVGVADGSELRAIDPAGNFRWSIEAGAPVKAIDWSSDEGFRVAYLAGGEVRVVTGDGVTDRAIAPAADVPPAWQPESDPATAIHRLTYVDPKNRVVSVATDSGRVLWRTGEFAADDPLARMVGGRRAPPGRRRRLRDDSGQPGRPCPQGADRDRRRARRDLAGGRRGRGRLLGSARHRAQPLQRHRAGQAPLFERRGRTPTPASARRSSRPTASGSSCRGPRPTSGSS